MTGIQSIRHRPCGKFALALTVIYTVLIAIFLSSQRKIKKWLNFGDEIEKSLKKDNIASKNLSNYGNTTLTSLLKYVAKIEEAHFRDSTGEYMIIPNVVTPGLGESNVTLSFCSQTSANHLNNLITLCDHWNGPVSVAVFTYGYEAIFAVYYIAYLHACFKNIQNSVRFHIVYPSSNPPTNLIILKTMETRCDKNESIVFDNKANYHIEIPYPNNILRNVAVRYSLATYISMIDIDMIPSLNLYESFLQFINKSVESGIRRDEIENERIAYVLPAFESKIDINKLDKGSLLKEWDKNNIRTYSYTRCKQCQRVTDYDKWRSLANTTFLDVGYFVNWYKVYEPFYITRKEHLPPWDERFKDWF